MSVSASTSVSVSSQALFPQPWPDRPKSDKGLTTDEAKELVPDYVFGLVKQFMKDQEADEGEQLTQEEACVLAFLAATKDRSVNYIAGGSEFVCDVDRFYNTATSALRKTRRCITEEWQYKAVAVLEPMVLKDSPFRGFIRVVRVADAPKEGAKELAIPLGGVVSVIPPRLSDGQIIGCLGPTFAFKLVSGVLEEVRPM